MKAAVYDRYGGPEVLMLREVNAPTVGDSDIMIGASLLRRTAAPKAGRSGAASS
jgi:hypothetical protein